MAKRRKKVIDPRARYAHKLQTKYGLTPEMYVRLLVYQGRRCAICQRSREELDQDFVVDHDHATEEVRGLLCHSCNRALGCLRDDIKTLQMASQYLISPPARKVLCHQLPSALPSSSDPT